MPSVIMLSVVMLSVIILTVIMLSVDIRMCVAKLNVVGPKQIDGLKSQNT